MAYILLLGDQISTQRRKKMKTVTDTFEKIMMAVAFAEAAEFEKARQFVYADRPARRPRPYARLQKRIIGR